MFASEESGQLETEDDAIEHLTLVMVQLLLVLVPQVDEDEALLEQEVVAVSLDISCSFFFLNSIATLGCER